MLNLLVKKQLMEIFRGYFYDGKKNRARSKAAVIGYFALFAVLMLGVLGGMFTSVSVMLCKPLVSMGLGWLYFAMLSLIAVLLGAFGSVFNTFSGLYMARDNDLLLSLPIPVHTVMAARLTTVYLMGLLYSGLVSLPAVIVYWVVAGISAANVFGGLLLVVLLSVLVMELSCALGWVVAQLSTRLKHKSIVTVLVSLVGIGAYYFVCARAQEILNDILLNAAAFGAAVRGRAYPLYLLGRVGEGDGTAMLLVAAVILALLVLVWRLLARSFLRVATASGRAARRTYREQPAKLRSVSSALFRKELARFLASPNYMLNCGLGLVMLPLTGILLLWKGGDVLSLVNQLLPGGDVLPVLLCTAVCAMASMNDMAVPSVALEGKSLYLLQSLPVAPWQVLRAKLSVQLVLSGGAMLVPFLCALFVLPVSPALLLAMLVALAFAALYACYSLLLGLHSPNLSWTNELLPIKQSLNVMIAIFSSWLYPLALGGLYLWQGWKLGAAAYLGAVLVLTLLAAVLLCRWLKTTGAARFAAL